MTDQVASRRLSRIKVLAERIESRRESNEFVLDTADAFELAKLVFEGLNKEGIPDEAPGSTHAKLDERLFEIEGRLADLDRIFGTLSDGQRDNFRTMLSRTEHNCDRISALELFADELRREDVGMRLAKLEFRAEAQKERTDLQTEVAEEALRRAKEYSEMHKGSVAASCEFYRTDRSASKDKP